MDLDPIREPDKSPTELEKVLITEDYYPELVQPIRELEAHTELDIYSEQLDNTEVIIRLGASKQRDIQLEDNSDSGSESESDSDIDSITANADFIKI
jgi:hypothetical protein